MVAVIIFKHGLGGERIRVSTTYVDSNDADEIRNEMKERGCDPDTGWRNGLYYSARVENIEPESKEEFLNTFGPKPTPTKPARKKNSAKRR